MPLKPIEELTFADDFMFGRVMQNPEICKGLLERLLEIKIEKVEYPTLQKTISPHYESKGVRLDVYVQDSDRVFDIEIQNHLDENIPKRTRYYQSMMDGDLLLKGKNYTQLKESFVIFVCKEDFFGEDMPCYFFSNTCRDKPDLQLGDMTYKVIFNASAFNNEKDLEKKSILEYIIDKKSTSEFTNKLDTLVEQTKLNEIFKGEYMAWSLAEFDAEQRGKKEGYSAGVFDGIQQGISQGIQQGISQGIQQGISKGIQQGAYEKAIETAKNMILKNIPIEIIAECTGLSIEEVNLISNNTK